MHLITVRVAKNAKIFTSEINVQWLQIVTAIFMETKSNNRKFQGRMLPFHPMAAVTFIVIAATATGGGCSISLWCGCFPNRRYT